MATGTYQTPITCGMCETSEDVDFFCLACRGNLCTNCQIGHTRVPMFKNHKVVPTLEGLKHKASEEDEECYTHPSSFYSMHCDDCNKLVCKKCISIGEHKGHNIGEIEAAIHEVRKQIMEYQTSLETIYLPQCKSEEAKIKQNIAECKRVTLSLKSNINKKRSEMITELTTEVNRYCGDLIIKAGDEEKHHILDMDKAKLKLQDTAEEIELLITKSKEALTKLASEQITFNMEKPSLTHLDVPKTPSLQFAIFKPGALERVQIREQIGELLIPKSQQSFAFDVSIIQRQQYAKHIYAVIPVDAYQGLVIEAINESNLRLIHIDGKEMNRLDTKFVISDFAVTAKSDIIATDYYGRCIRIMTQTGQVTKTIKTKPNKPSGVCLGNNDQEIVVCTNTVFSSKLVVYSRDGKEIRIINYTNKPVDDFICAGQRVTRNNLGHYCVAQCGHNKVYVIDSNGALRYTYDGSGAWKMKRKFVPTNICSDIYNHLFISDYHNKNIHMLDDEGRFLRFLFTEQDGISKPTGLCIDLNERLWVGQRNGELCIVKYLK